MKKLILGVLLSLLCITANAQQYYKVVVDTTTGKASMYFVGNILVGPSTSTFKVEISSIGVALPDGTVLVSTAGFGAGINTSGDTQFYSGSFSTMTVQGSRFSVGGSTFQVHDGGINFSTGTTIMFHATTTYTDSLVMTPGVNTPFNYAYVGQLCLRPYTNSSISSFLMFVSSNGKYLSDIHHEFLGGNPNDANYPMVFQNDWGDLWFGDGTQADSVKVGRDKGSLSVPDSLTASSGTFTNNLCAGGLTMTSGDITGSTKLNNAYSVVSSSSNKWSSHQTNEDAITGIIRGNGLGTYSAASVGNTDLASDGASLSKVTAGNMSVSGSYIGIGTTNPAVKLDVRSVDTGTFSRITSANADASKQLTLVSGNNAYSSTILWNGGDLQFGGGYNPNGTGGISPTGTWMLIQAGGTITALPTYGNAVGVTNRIMYIDNTGLIGTLLSTRKVKHNILDMENTDWFYKLHPVNFLYNKDTTNTKQYGLIAEEVEQVNPLMITYESIKKPVISTGTPTMSYTVINSTQPQTVEYNKFIPVLIKVCQDQQKEIQALTNRVYQLEISTH